MMDSRGWYWFEKARIRVAYRLFVALDVLWFTPLYRLHLPVNAADSRLWLRLAAECYLYGNLKRGDMPENVRVGGVWR